MLRELLRVGQRAVRIQLDRSTTGSSVVRSRETSFRVPQGGIPGYWVEKPTKGTRKAVDGLFERSIREDEAVRNVADVGWEEERITEDLRERSHAKKSSEEDVGVIPVADALPATISMEPLEIQAEPATPPTADIATSTMPSSSPLSAAAVEIPTSGARLESTQDTDPPVVEASRMDPTVGTLLTTQPSHVESRTEAESQTSAAITTPTVDSAITMPESTPEVRIEEPQVQEVPQQQPAKVVSAELDDVEQRPPQVTLRPSTVPSSRIGRIFHYGSLVAGMSLGAAGEVLRRSTGQSSQGSVFMSEANIRRLVDKLSKMRGAALKLGQFMSIQDTNMLPEQLEKVLQQVQANADYMPDWQLERVLRAELGNDWEDSFSSFPRVPMAAASIGQVHAATLKNGRRVAVKVQFPGVEDSISSDLNNLSLLLRGSAVLPKGLFLNNTVKVFRGELADECNYDKEAENGRRMKQFLEDESFFEVPEVIDELSTRRVLTTELMSGRPLSEIKGFSQELRDKVGTAVLRLCLLELFRYRLMQTDPNWANFLWDDKKQKLQLIDFGATREYSVEFMDKWYRLLKSVIDNDREAMREYSLKVGYLTGEENEAMLDAHLRSMELLAVPFTEATYDFSSQSVTDEVKKLIPTMLKYRLTPPPNETYSLNRKLSGSFLLCAKLGSRVNCRELWDDVVGDYKVSSDV